MARRCEICGKTPVMGRTIARRGLAKKAGGVGKKITGISPRRFLPNLRRVRALWQGTPRSLRVCTGCLRSGRILKAPRRQAAQVVTSPTSSH